MLASIVHIVNGDWSSLVEALTDMDVIRPGVNTRRFTLVYIYYTQIFFYKMNILTSEYVS